ncbi:MAG: hypothetical protein ACHQ1G_07285, partial [Planctomycetota bacterium]
AVALLTEAQSPAHRGRPTTVFFVKLAEDSDPAHQPVLLRSNYKEDNVHYLLDAAPGRYAVVACIGKGEGPSWTAYFPESLIVASAKDVPEGKAVLLGSFKVDLRSVTTTGDAAQHHYLGVLSPHFAKQSAALRLFTKEEHAWGGPWLDMGDEADVRARMKKSLGPDWASRFE